jgi:hypothetical protein
MNANSLTIEAGEPDESPVVSDETLERIAQETQYPVSIIDCTGGPTMCATYCSKCF